MNLNHIDLNQSNWTQSLFRMTFVRKFGTTDKVPIRESFRRELGKSYMHGVVRKIEENSIPLSLVLFSTKRIKNCTDKGIE